VLLIKITNTTRRRHKGLASRRPRWRWEKEQWASLSYSNELFGKFRGPQWKGEAEEAVARTR